MLYVVATPIGNVEDLSDRARRVLGEVALIAAEDTRIVGRLLARHGFRTPTTSFFEHNEERKVPEIIRFLEEGKDVALISDAGTPLVSDPGYRLVKEAAVRGIRVVPVPGPSAVMAALSVSGLPTDRFTFVGFLPRKAGKRKRELVKLAEIPHTLVFFESPHRIHRTLKELRGVMGERAVVLCRELTKPYEEILRGSLSELVDVVEARRMKGEITLVVGGKGSDDRIGSVEREAHPGIGIEEGEGRVGER